MEYLHKEDCYNLYSSLDISSVIRRKRIK